MGKFVRAGAAVAAVGLFTVLAPTAAEAGSQKRGDLKVCFDNEIAALAGLQFDATADGDSFRSKTLRDGKCKRWHVRTGQYEIRQDNQNEFFDAIFGLEQNPCAEDFFPELTAEITRNGEDVDVEFGRSVELTTNVQRDRTTKIEFLLSCVAGLGGVS